MRVYRKIVLVILIFAGGAILSYGQAGYGSQDPPAPNSGAKGQNPEPCPGQDDDDDNSTPPPPGLCLPIDSNIYFLMAIGAMYGAYKLRKPNTDLSS